MRFLSKFSIAVLLPVAMVSLVLVSVGVSIWVSYRVESQELMKLATQSLEALRTERRERLERDLTAVSAEIVVAATRNATVRTMNSFARSWRLLDDPQQELQKTFITDNPHPQGKRADLSWSGDNSTYSTVHAQTHDEFRAMLETYGYHDVFLVDLEGNVIYSVKKEEDFATNLQTGKFRESGLARVYQQVMKLEAGETAFEDFSPYAPSAGGAAAFIAHPIFDRQGGRVGALVYQISDSLISGIANAPTGLGQTGRVYFVGGDHLNRSGVDDTQGDGSGPNGLERIETLAVQMALAGETGSLETQGHGGERVLVAFGPLNALGKNWAVIAEQDMSEVMSGVRDLLNMLVLNGLIVTALVSVVALWFSRSLVNPLAKVTRSMVEIGKKNYKVKVDGTERGDEIGEISKSLEQFRQSLLEAEETARENEFRGAAFSSSSAAIMMVNNDLDILHMNEAGMALLQKHEARLRECAPDFTAKDIIGKNADLFHPPALRERVRNLLLQEENLPYRATISVTNLRLNLDINRVHGPDGNPIGYVVEWVDVTEDFMNTALLSSIDSNQVKIEFAPDGVATKSNNLFRKILGAGTKLDDLTLEGLLKEQKMEQDKVDDILASIHRGESVFGRYDLASSEGGRVTFEGGITPVICDKGDLLNIVLIATDVTETRREIEASEVRRAEMEAAQNRVVDALRDGLSRLSDGDLTTEITDAFSENYEQLRHDFNRAVDNLLTAMRGVVENAEMIQGEASEISNAADDLSQRTERQAATLEETATALDELTSSVRSAADGAAHANEVVESARKNAEVSGEVVREAVEAMGEIETSSLQISKITGVIDDIAFQTNLLALNAGVEAARAGEAGRGFAVVASEVRALAQRSSDAAREINELISASGSQVKRGVHLVDQAGEALVGIVESVSEISRNVGEIAISAREQSAGLAEINEAVNQLDQVTQQNAAMFEQTTAASHSLTCEAQTLTSTMSRFKTDQAERPAAQIIESDVFVEPVLQTEESALHPHPLAAPKSSVAIAQQIEADHTYEDWDEF
ncbi:hypothetical protein AKJ29_10940 [Aliiroseovarius crassostreae]|uniref:Chemotaxis protein n=1 Tax=Aliiroseovarius crassostreae TaxID=154981 RepID=A0A0P7IVJ6_9RHOB|nr:methyl-accepting chemotaxis protein [Aliiroseovarius crassostreae]KPN63206.1 hypothetical protein AKJ29_10940 [Aliiroseovarius crassostreae]